MAGATPDVKLEVEQLLAGAGLAVRRVTVGDEEARLHLDGPTLSSAERACAGAGALVSVGSGSVADLGKAVSARLGGVPHVVVQTAASVNGFADDQSVLLVDGVKRTTASRWPDRLVIDTDVVGRAPARLNRAGLGDLLATFTAPADWRLASFVGQDDSYSPAVVALAREHVDPVLDRAAGIASGEPAAVETLAAGLTLSGISMGVAGRTSPGSGMEHTVSHLIEMAERPDTPAPLHGAKVGVLTLLASLLWARLREDARRGALSELRFPPEGEMRARVHDALARLDPSGRMGEECWRDYSDKFARWHDARDDLLRLEERWPAFEAEVESLLAPPERLARALREAGAPLRLSELGVDAETARWALAHCHLLRDRFTVADLAFLTGRWGAADVDRLLEDAAALGGGL